MTSKKGCLRIVYLHRGYFPMLAGAETMMYRIASTLCQRGHEVHIVSQSQGDDFERTVVDGMQVLRVPSHGLTNPEMWIDARPDIVHVVDAVWPTYVQAALALAHMWRVPLAVTPASIMSTWQDPEAIFNVCRQADMVFVLTAAERATFIRHGVTTERLFMTSQGYELVGEPDAVAFRRSYGMTGPIVLFLGRKVSFKGYTLLLQATHDVWQSHPETQFVFIGPRWDDDCAELFMTYADPRITEIGIVDEATKHSALMASDIVCLPTISDIFPLVYVEAWACGKPVIASRFPGVEEVVRHGEDGLIVDPDPKALATTLKHLLSQPSLRSMMGMRGLERVNAEFSWEIVADQIEAAYGEVIDR